MKTETTTYAYYPGCSQTVTNKAYDVSTRAIAQALGLDLIEIDDWNCCGATAYIAVREKQAFVLSARNLALAEQMECDLVTPCNGCYVVLRKANKYIAESPGLHEEIDRALGTGGLKYRGTVRVRHFLEVVLEGVGEAAIRGQVRHPLRGLKVAPYYGCQLSRPYGEAGDQEFPCGMDDLIAWLGADAVPFPMKTKCCGGLMMTTQPEIGRKLTGKILRQAKQAGADCIITCCSLCLMNLEAYQREVGEALGCDCHIPVLYFTQLMGHAFGLPEDQLALSDSLTPVEAVLNEKVASV